MVILTIIMASLTSVLVSASHTEIDVNKRFQAQQNDRTGLDEAPPRGPLRECRGPHERELAHPRHRVTTRSG